MPASSSDRRGATLGGAAPSPAGDEPHRSGRPACRLLMPLTKDRADGWSFESQIVHDDRARTDIVRDD